jgi:hypothetical protein
MRLFAHFAFRTPAGHRCTSAILLLAYVVTAAGVPISFGRRSAQSGEVYPCMAGGCGCKSADQCWRSCCCHSLAERLAWARARGIDPPAFALAQARAMGLHLASIGKPSSADNRTQSCCTRHKQSSRACASAARCEKDSAGGASHLIAWRALACRGQSLHWLAAVPSLVLVRPELSQVIPHIDWLGPTGSEVASGRSNCPVVPPPERA